MRTLRCVLATTVVAALAACGTKSGIEDQESPVALVVRAIQLLDSPSPFGDVFDDDTGGAFGDFITVTLASVILNQGAGTPGVTAPGDLTDIQLERFRVTWTRIDGGVDLPDSHEEPITQRITPGGTLTLNTLTVLSAVRKFQFPLFYLRPDSLGYEPATGFDSIQAQGTIEFFGHLLSGEAVSARGQFRIEWTNWADENN
jgi:hypothetical protein